MQCNAARKDHGEGTGRSMSKQAQLPSRLRMSWWSTSCAASSQNGTEEEQGEGDGLSSTSPHRSIWLRTSTREASLAWSTVKWPSTKASAMMNDLVEWTARSNAVGSTSVSTTTCRRAKEGTDLPI